MPSLLDAPRMVTPNPVADEIARKKAEQDALMAARQQETASSKAAADRAAQESQQKQLGSTMKVDALQWTQNPAYQQPWAKAPAEARQHFVDAYGGVAEKAPEVWNQTVQQNTGLIPGLEHMTTGQSATVNPAGEVTQHFEGPPREAPHYLDPTKPVSRFDPATGVTTPITSGEVPADVNESDDALIDKIGNYEAPPPWMRGGYPAAQKARISAILAQRFPGYDAKEYQARQTALQGFKSGIQARNITSANTVVGHLGALVEAGNALHNRSIPAWNSLANATQAATGDPAKARFDTARDAVITELAALFKGTGAAPSAEEIKHWRDRMDSSMSPDQMNGVISEMTGLMKSRLDALQEQWDKGVKAPRDKPFLTPKSRAILRKLGHEPDAIDPLNSPAGDTPAPAENITREAYEKLPSGAPYVWNGQQLIKK